MATPTDSIAKIIFPSLGVTLLGGNQRNPGAVRLGSEGQSLNRTKIIVTSPQEFPRVSSWLVNQGAALSVKISLYLSLCSGKVLLDHCLQIYFYIFQWSRVRQSSDSGKTWPKLHPRTSARLRVLMFCWWYWTSTRPKLETRFQTRSDKAIY